MNTTQNIDTTAIDLISYQDARRTTELGLQILEVEQLLWIAGGGKRSSTGNEIFASKSTALRTFSLWAGV